jgi:site-specific recombinase XerD
VDNVRRIFNSFYNYCVVNGLLYRNPCKKIDAIKGAKKIKKPFSNAEIIKMREHFDNLREEAIFELLLSSGMRIGELVRLKKSEMNMEDKTVIVTGKGNKQRECFFNDLAKHKLQKYLDSRDDDNPYLFVSLHKPHNNLLIGGVARSLRELGGRAGVNKVHPHRFRRTFATKLLHKGVPIDQIQKFLGHTQIETTQLYAISDDEEIEYNIKRYVN